MDFKIINSTMFNETRSDDIPSMPFIAMKDGKRYIVWFFYEFTEGDKLFSLTIKKLCVLDEEINYVKVSPPKELVLSSDIIECGEPTMDLAEYLEAVGNLYESFSQEDMNRLIRRAEYAAIVPIYDDVRRMLFGN